MAESVEQRCRDLLELCGVEDAQSMTAGDLCPLANELTKVERLQTWKADVEDSTKAAMCEACDANERHCTCVPLLRVEIKRPQTENDSWEETVNAMLRILSVKRRGTAHGPVEAVQNTVSSYEGEIAKLKAANAEGESDGRE